MIGVRAIVAGVVAVLDRRSRRPTSGQQAAADRADGEIHRRRRARRHRLRLQLAQPAQLSTRSRSGRDYVFRVGRRAGAVARALCLDAEPTRRRIVDSVCRLSASRLRGFALLAASCCATCAAPPPRSPRARTGCAICAARSAVRPAEPHLFQRAARSGDRRRRSAAARRPRCSTSTSTISRTSTIRSAIRSATS